MNVQEQPLQIAGDGFDMLGILSLPAPGTPTLRTAVLIVVGGAQYRAGSHRQFVLLARRLAAAGYPVLRFDLPGMGDSPGDPVPFENTAPHIAAALDAAGWQTDYVALRQQSDLRAPAPGTAPGTGANAAPLVVLAAARLGKTRLIDNLEI